MERGGSTKGGGGVVRVPEKAGLYRNFQTDKKNKTPTLDPPHVRLMCVAKN